VAWQALVKDVPKNMLWNMATHAPGKPGKVGNFTLVTGQGKVREIGKSQGSCGLPQL